MAFNMGGDRRAERGSGGGITRTISIASGKGGVGKTTLVSNIALHLGSHGKRVLILDGDLGMANVDIMFGVRPEKNILDIIRGEAQAAEVLVEVAPNVSLLPGGHGLLDLQNLGPHEKQALLAEVGALGARFDVMLIDTAPGIADNVLYLSAAARDIHVVVTPDPASLADSYALIKVLNQRYRESRFSIICNQVNDEAEALRLFTRLNDVAGRFLFVSLDFAGHVPSDPILRQATKAQKLVLKTAPHSASSRAIGEISRKFAGWHGVEGCKGGLQFFWEQLVGVA